MNKVLVTVYVPLLDKDFDIFIPVNKKVGTVKQKIIETINEFTEDSLSGVKLKLYNKDKCKEYNNNIYVKESNIINGTKLILL